MLTKKCLRMRDKIADIDMQMQDMYKSIKAAVLGITIIEKHRI